MFKSVIPLLAAVEFCLAVNIGLTDLSLTGTKLGKVCLLKEGETVPTCAVMRNEYVYLSGTWVVDGHPDGSFLTSLLVSLEYADGNGNILNIPVCENGNIFVLGDYSCVELIVDSGNYAMESYKFTTPNPSRQIIETLKIKASTVWSDGTSKDVVVGEINTSLL